MRRSLIRNIVKRPVTVASSFFNVKQQQNQVRFCAAAAPQEVIPDLTFLSSKEVLLETTQGTIDACEVLLQKIHEVKTPGEKHDILDTVSNILCLLLDPCEFVRQIHPDQEYKAFASEAFDRGHDFMCRTNGRKDLYDVLAELDSPESKKELTEEQQRNVTQMKRDLEFNGIHLPDKKREHIAEMNMEKEELANKFIMDATTGKGNAFGTLRNLLECRHQLALDLGFESWAEKELQGTMLKNPQSVWHFLCGVHHKYREGAEKELDILQSRLGEVKGRDLIKDEDRARIAHSIQQAAEPDNLGKYFTVGNCIRGIQQLCSNVFGVKLEKQRFNFEEKLSVDAMKFHVYEEDTNKFLGVIVVDMFSRGSKHCQAGHLTIQLGCKPPRSPLEYIPQIGLPEIQRPVVCLTCNAGSLQGTTILNKRPDGSYDPESTTMNPHEVVTAFHEFGHALHTIFAQTTVQNLAGTRGSIDFVEIFSQLFEKFLTNHEFLKGWACEVGTGTPITVDIVEKRNKAANMFHHMDTLDQVQLASVDQVLHGPRPFTVYFANGPSGHIGKRTLGKMDEYGRGFYNLSNLIIDIVRPMSLVEPTQHGVLKSLSFEHLSTYPAGYYGYLYSNTIAKRIWEKKFADKPMNREAGKELVKMVMSHGAACDQHEVIQKYLGDDLNDIDVWA